MGSRGNNNKFVSVNLNKSFGYQNSSSSSNHHYHYNHGQVAAGRGRGFPPGGGGGGMVVLARPRSSQKAAPKLSVPPPLNLPSLRREHEKFDLAGAAGSGVAGGGSGSGARLNSAGVGWRKPKADAIVLHESDRAADGGVGKESGGYVAQSVYIPPAERAMVLRGEDFPALKAALPTTTSGTVQKWRDNSQQKQKQGLSEEFSNEQKDSYHHSFSVHVRPQGGHSTYSTHSIDQDLRSGGSNVGNQSRKQEDFPISLVHLNPRSDWADDERDTGHRFSGDGNGHGFTTAESYWDRDIDMSKANAFPQKLTSNSNTFDRWGMRGNDSGKGHFNEVLNVDSYHRDVLTSSWEVNILRPPPPQKEFVNDRVGTSQPTIPNKESGRETKYIPPHIGNGEPAFGRRDTTQGPDLRKHWNHSLESGSNVYEQRDRFPTEKSSRYIPQNRSVSKSSFSFGGKGSSMSDPIRSFGRDRPYLEDPLSKDFSSTGFDEGDPFSGVVGVIKRKREAVKQTDFHDPVREFFEAELERVQKMQETERQRIIEEQERVVEQARKEEEERQRLIREDEELQRRLEEEAQEAAWREEQERLEAVKRAEEQKIAKEEEKRRVYLEEERRKIAAKQKLLELEAKIARRRGEAVAKGDNSVSVVDEKVSSGMKEANDFGEADLDDWEDSERMVERITTSASSDSVPLNRSFMTNYSLPPSGEPSSRYLERGKSVNSWRRGILANGSSMPFAMQEPSNIHYSLRRDASVGGREFYGGVGYFPSSTYPRGVMQESYPGNRWNASGDGDPFSRNSETVESYQNVSKRYDDAAWEQRRTRVDLRSPYPEQLYPNCETDELYSYGRSRYSMRQPRVLPPPPSIPSFRGELEHHGPSTSLENNDHQNYVASETALQAEYYDKSDESRDSPTIPASEEEKGNSFVSGNDSVILNTSGEDRILTSPSSISVVEDEEWTLDKSEEMQEQEEYDEDGYLEEDEVHEVDDENVDLAHEFESIHLEDKGSSHMMDNLVLGFDEGVQVGLPSDEFERNPGVEANNIEIPEVYVAGVEEQGSIDGRLATNQDTLQSFACSSQSSEEIALNTIDEIENTNQESVLHPTKNASPSSFEADLLNSTNNASCGSEQPAKHTVSSSVDMTSDSSYRQPIMSGVSSVPNQADLPVKLQFGLFTGPSLIPSPIPAIQIGSIQMPLHMHVPVDPSVTLLKPPQPPLFQFGQLRYTSPISKGILPMPPRSMSFVQPNMQHHYNLNQNSSGSIPIRHSHEAYYMKDDDVTYLSVNNQPSVVSRASDLSEDNGSTVLNSSSARGSADSSAIVHKTGSNIPHTVDNMNVSQSVFCAEDKEHHDSVVKNLGQSNKKGNEGQGRSSSSYRVNYREKHINVSRVQGALSGNMTKKFPYPVGTYSSRSAFPATEPSHLDSNGSQRRSRRAIQRTEFRVRQSSGPVPSDSSTLDDKSNLNDRGFEISTRTGFKRGTMTTRPLKHVVESGTLSSGPTNFQDLDAESKVAEVILKEELPGNRDTSVSREGNMGTNIFEENIDSIPQGGVVCVFRQCGIEAPSDEDDFIEVRSKRQMLNDRREQREKEIKAKSRVMKPPQKSRYPAQSAMVSNSLNKISESLAREAPNNNHTSFLVSERQGKVNREVSSGFTPMASQQLAPIGTPSMIAESGSDAASHTKSLHRAINVISGRGKEDEPCSLFENHSKVLDSIQPPMGSWGNAQTNQQVMALTQTQLDEAMKPAHFETHLPSIGVHTTSELISASSSSIPKEKPVSASASPINSLLAGKKIQFGAVTSPTVLPSTSHVSRGIGPPGEFLPDVQMSCTSPTVLPSTSHVSPGIGPPGAFLPDVQMSCTSPTVLPSTSHVSPGIRPPGAFLPDVQMSCNAKADKFPEEPCGHLKDCKEEAKEAASAVAVAAISSDKIVRNGFSPVLISDDKKSGGGDAHGIVEGVSGDQLSRSHSRAEESLSVSLPADLSVDTPPMLWPSLPSPQNSSSQMLSHFPGAPPSHFPLFEMNPMLGGGPLFAFNSHEESGGTQSESQKSTLSSQGHLGTWQQCHPTVESFYGPPAGFTGPFISPPGVIPGVPAPPHMFVYNHYATVGQFGQVGCFMGASYIPSGKQPEWKHNTASSGLGTSEGEMNNMNTVAAQQNSPNMPAPMHNLAPGLPLLPMPSPMAMFDVSPFQASPDMSVQGRWPHGPALPLHSVPLSLPLQQQAEGVLLNPRFSHGHPVEQLKATRFTESQTTAASDSDQAFPVVTDTRFTQFDDTVDLVDLPSSSVNMGASLTTSAANSDAVQIDSANTSIDQNMNSFKPQHSQQKNLSSQKYNNSAGYASYQKGGASRKSNSAGVWPHHRTAGSHGRNYSLGAEKNLSTSKVRQIYVAKQTSGS